MAGKDIPIQVNREIMRKVRSKALVLKCNSEDIVELIIRNYPGLLDARNVGLAMDIDTFSTETVYVSPHAYAITMQYSTGFEIPIANYVSYIVNEAMEMIHSSPDFLGEFSVSVAEISRAHERRAKWKPKSKTINISIPAHTHVKEMSSRLGMSMTAYVDTVLNSVSQQQAISAGRLLSRQDLVSLRTGDTISIRVSQTNWVMLKTVAMDCGLPLSALLSALILADTGPDLSNDIGTIGPQEMKELLMQSLSEGDNTGRV